ncbi:MAG TPA: hypothetical protein P5205_17655 [Candidatus Paceibacterota bacterium]|nr:hypothetical protein [Verrucomicrobiota bacterium]HSA12190.1 hypothetical protein [Candidatus Paceibacterota bacterium]
MSELEAAIKAYSEAFSNLDELMVPQLMELPEFAGFLMAGVKASRPRTREDAEKEFGAIAWDW